VDIECKFGPRSEYRFPRTSLQPIVSKFVRGDDIYSKPGLKLEKVQMMAPGLQWKEAGSETTQTGSEIQNDKLAAALMRLQLRFSQEELDAFDLSLLSYDSCIIVDAKRFKPVSIGAEMIEFTNKKLAEACKTKQVFSQKELHSFEVSELTFDNYIKVADICYKPTSDAWPLAEADDALLTKFFTRDMLPVLKRSGDNWNLLRDAWIHLQNQSSSMAGEILSMVKFAGREPALLPAYSVLLRLRRHDESEVKEFDFR
jgi:hypothetical protein